MAKLKRLFSFILLNLITFFTEINSNRKSITFLLTIYNLFLEKIPLLQKYCVFHKISASL